MATPLDNRWHSSAVVTVFVVVGAGLFMSASNVSLSGQLDTLKGMVKGRETDVAKIEEAYLDLARQHRTPQDLGLIYARLSQMYCETGLSEPGRANKAVQYAEAALEYPLDLVSRLQVAIQKGDAMQNSDVGYSRDEIARVYLEGYQIALAENIPEKRIPLPAVSKSDVEGNPEDPAYQRRLSQWSRAHNTAIAARESAYETNKAVVLRKALESQTLALYSDDSDPSAPSELSRIALDVLQDENQAWHLTHQLENREL